MKMEKIMKTYNTLERVRAKDFRLALIIGLSGFVTTLVMGGMLYHVSKNNMMAVDKDGDIVSLMRTSEDAVRMIEADNHIRLFYDRFFSYNKSNYEQQVELGLHLCGLGGKLLYEAYRDKNWYNSVVNNDLEVESFVVGDIRMEYINGVLTFQADGMQRITKGKIVEERKLDITGNIFPSKGGRVAKLNPHGLKIDNIVITDNSKVDNEKK